MTIVSELKSDFNEILTYGEQVRFKYYNISLGAGSYYDDDSSLSQSGNDFWVSGIVQPISSNQYNSDSLLVQQGKLLQDDKKLYVDGATQTSGLGPIKKGMNGSPPTQEYRILEDGQVTEWAVNGSVVYKKIYCRFLNNGSFVGEA